MNFKHIKLNECDSTSLTAKQLLNTENKPFIVSSITQTNGRGRIGNKWLTQSGGIYISFVINSQDYIYTTSHYPYLSALIVQDFLHENKFKNIQLKWPNDLLINDKKISGILIEKIDDSIIIGIGVNINQDQSFFEETKLKGTSYLLEKNEFGNISELTENLIHSFNRVFELYLNAPAEIYSNFLMHAKNLNQLIRCRVSGKVMSGIFAGLGKDGEMLLKTDLGLEKIFSGELIE